MRHTDEQRTTRVLHPSLTRAITMGGIPRLYFLANWFTAVIILAMNINNINLVFIGLVLTAAIFAHAAMTAACKKDVRAIDVYFRNIKYQDFYPAKAHPTAPSKKYLRFRKPNIQ